MTTLNIEGKKVRVSDGFLSLSPDEQARTVEEIASQMQIKPSGGGQMMSQVNRGISDAVGGAVDFLNPFDKPHALNPFPEGTGSAREGLTSAMEGAGIDVAQGEPETAWQGFQRGMGQAAGSAIPATGMLKALGGAGGLIGNLSDDAYRSLASILGFGTEMAAGGTSEAARVAARNEGAPGWVQDTAAIAAGGLALPAATALPRFAPSVVGGKRVADAVKRTVAPYTEAGGREVARKRMQQLAGGEGRAAEIARSIEPDNEFGLTPAQQSQDPNMMGLERLAAEQDPALRARLDARRQASQDRGRQAVQELGGDEGDAETFFSQRRQAFKADLTERANKAIADAEAQIASIGPVRRESENSVIVRQQIDRALADALAEEKALWEAIPNAAQVGTANTKAAVERLSGELGYAQRFDMPERAQEVTTADEVYGEAASVRDMKSLYSDLRRVARSAMAGNDQNKNRARLANEIADAILKDLGAVDGTTAIGQQINEARAYSAALHETFDRGAPGRLLKRTLDGDTSVDPELALRRSVGRSGPEGAVGARQIEEATGGSASPSIQDYIKDRFSQAVNSATGDFTYGAARKFIRDNKELLARYPELRSEIDAAVLGRESAEQFSSRITSRISDLASKKSAGQAVIDGRTVQAVLGAKAPAREARKIVNEARKDPSGKALAGVKASFADELISGATGVKSGGETFSGDRLLKQISDPKMRAALQQVFGSAELGRLQRIARDMAKVSGGDAADIGTSLSGEKPSKIIEYLARVVAARHGAQMGGGGGGSLQTAQMASSRTKEILGRLVSDKASDILARAVEDPELFRALLTDSASAKLDEKVLPRLVPYLVGATAATATKRDADGTK